MTMIPSAPIRLTDNSGPEIRATPVEPENKRSAAAKQSWEKRRSEKSVQEAEADRKRQRYEAQEAKRAQPIQPDQTGVLVVTLILAGLAMVTSGIISYNGITSVATFVGLSETWMAGLFFGFVELLIVVFTLMYLVYGSRVHDNGKKANSAFEFAGMVTFSAIAVYGNLIHTLEFHGYVLDIESITGLVLSVSAPVAVIWLTKSASRVLFARAVAL